MRDRYPIHGRRWTWRHPTGWTCRCGLDAWPCPVQRMLARSARSRPSRLDVQLQEVGRDGVRNTRHYRWSGGSR